MNSDGGGVFPRRLRPDVCVALTGPRVGKTGVNLPFQDEIKAPWPLRQLNTCLSFPQFKAKQFQSVIQTHLINNQFHLDGGQNKSDPASREYSEEIVTRLAWLVM